MSFAGDLNAKVDSYYEKERDVLTEEEFVADRVRQYTSDIKTLCNEQAERGMKGLKGFFVPERTDYDYITTTDGPFILDKPKSLIGKKPYKNMCGGLYEGNLCLDQAGIYLFDGKNYGKRVACQADSAAIEKVRVGVLSNLAGEGFRRLEIEHLTGPVYGLQKILFSEVIATVGTKHYFYVDIAW